MTCVSGGNMAHNSPWRITNRHGARSTGFDRNSARETARRRTARSPRFARVPPVLPPAEPVEV
jgi:hypothetical protein